MRKNSVLIGCFLLLVSVALAQSLPKLYDPRIKSSKPSLSLEETRQIDKDLVYLEKNFWSKELKKRTDSCQSLPTVKDLLGRASGSFVEKNTKEILYSFGICGGGEGNGASILLIYRDQRFIQAYQVIPQRNFGICGFGEMFSIKDINLNGLSELGIHWGCGDGPYSGSTLEILEFETRTAHVVFRHEVEFHFGTDESNNEDLAFIFHVIKATIPTVIGQSLSWIEKTQTWIPTDKLEVLKSDPKQEFIITKLEK